MIFGRRVNCFTYELFCQGLKGSTGFSQTEVFRKYLWYLLR